ncbi:LacI family DNA-binding transcriptional regulator [Microbacterium sp. M3]|uniref:LacI family DNA-binding transcriptional regulator n=1 Tax=Microbacterium arthrosphaerae TaxID=792652 RepID=A0ABU4GXX6_9MICO|nr:MULTISPECIES: LacI family DNA-binding transcriptional regulator [Microbacterium]MDW4571933.1 LacI family DNA-binding transcriptional regulator [Microbacterium arthrosphaerae]MDW7605788.1 LacI family DNA-binding transcriptional regulator [Microbacterium sp. M3]
MDSAPVPPDSRRIGVREVARAAGVSTQTVSRVLNEHPNIRPETRQRVLQAISDLGYRVNNAARALGTRTTRTLGVIASDATLYGPAVGIAALEAAARDAGRWIATAYADASAEASVRDAADRLLAQGVDGLVVLAPHAATLAALTGAHPGIAIAALHAGPGAERQEEGAALAVSHLVELGHRCIGRVAGPEEWLEARSRETGTLRALAAAGLEPGPRWGGDWTAGAGARLAAEVAAAVRTPDGPTAVAVANDQMALGLIAGLREAGLDVPGEVSVVGFDDNPDAAYYRPALTTVGLDLEGEARRAVAAVLGETAEQAASPQLVVRASTARPR